MPALELTVLSLRYSSWSMRPWLALTQAQADFRCRTVELESFDKTTLAERRTLGSVTGLFPVLRVDGVAIHESLAICEYVAEAFPAAALWPEPRLERARARALCSEMVSNFGGLRSELTCHLFGRVPRFAPSERAEREIARVRELWWDCLGRSGGPFLFGAVSLADFFYFPVLTRFRTYGVALDAGLELYARTLEDLPAVRALVAKAREEPAIPSYDDFLRKLGGNPDATR